ncbi:hypothetical protein B0H14DRAFT_2602506 [Mycena olivaceomarginata]|nr:hypothetical protein B0H14DRAFT_2602506 [Mycena olivaceomarginata]
MYPLARDYMTKEPIFLRSAPDILERLSDLAEDGMRLHGIRALRRSRFRKPMNAALNSFRRIPVNPGTQSWDTVKAKSSIQDLVEVSALGQDAPPCHRAGGGRSYGKAAVKVRVSGWSPKHEAE